jgi:hypothetical protein
MADTHNWPNWEDEDRYWRTNYSDRPYVSAGKDDYDLYRPGYQFGYEGAKRFQGNSWNDVESDMSRAWNSFEHRGITTWEQMKGAVRDAWERVTGHRTVGTW